RAVPVRRGRVPTVIRVPTPRAGSPAVHAGLSRRRHLRLLRGPESAEGSATGVGHRCAGLLYGHRCGFVTPGPPRAGSTSDRTVGGTRPRNGSGTGTGTTGGRRGRPRNGTGRRGRRPASACGTRGAGPGRRSGGVGVGLQPLHQPVLPHRLVQLGRPLVVGEH